MGDGEPFSQTISEDTESIVGFADDDAVSEGEESEDYDLDDIDLDLDSDEMEDEELDDIMNDALPWG